MAADPAPDDDPLPTDVPTLHAMVRQLRAELAEVKGKLDRLLAVTFRRSERSKRPRTPPPDADRPPRPRHRHGRSPLPEHLERVVVTHDLTPDQRACPCCGGERVCIGEQAAEQLDCDPIRYFVRRTIRVSYAYRRDWDGFDNAFSVAGNGWGGTKMTRWHNLRIDHILSTREFRVRRTAVGPESGSDHRPTAAELELLGDRAHSQP